MIPTAIAAFVLLLAVVYLIGRPFVLPLRYAPGVSLEQLEADRDRLRAQLRELDMDFETGKLAREEFERLHARRVQQIEATTRAIHEAQLLREAPASPTISPDPTELDRELEDRISARKRQLEELEAPACPGCGIPIDPDDRFCRRCGADLATAEVNDR